MQDNLHKSVVEPTCIAANAGSLEVLQYFITEKNCNPATPDPPGLTPH